MSKHPVTLTGGFPPRSTTRGRSPLRVLCMASALLAAALLAGCGSKGGDSSPTAPTPEPFDFTFPAAGQSVQRAFTTAGTFAYRCAVHQGLGMTGTVIVSASSTLDSQLVLVGHNDGYTFTPATATIKPGGVIRWLREAGPSGTTLNNHTATRP